jgi:hypothetical protein
MTAAVVPAAEPAPTTSCCHRLRDCDWRRTGDRDLVDVLVEYGAGRCGEMDLVGPRGVDNKSNSELTLVRCR